MSSIELNAIRYDGYEYNQIITAKYTYLKSL